MFNTGKAKYVSSNPSSLCMCTALHLENRWTRWRRFSTKFYWYYCETKCAENRLLRTKIRYDIGISSWFRILSLTSVIYTILVCRVQNTYCGISKLPTPLRPFGMGTVVATLLEICWQTFYNITNALLAHWLSIVPIMSRSWTSSENARSWPTSQH